MQHWPELAIVLAILLVVSTVLAAKGQAALVRGLHLLLARMTETVLMDVLVREMTADLGVASLAVTGALIAQAALQYLAVRDGRANAVVGGAELLVGQRLVVARRTNPCAGALSPRLRRLYSSWNGIALGYGG